MREGSRKERSSSSHCWNVGDCWPWFWGLMQGKVFKGNLALLHRSQYYTGCGDLLVLCLGLLSPWVLAYVWRVLNSHNEMDIMCTVTRIPWSVMLSFVKSFLTYTSSPCHLSLLASGLLLKSGPDVCSHGDRLNTELSPLDSCTQMSQKHFKKVNGSTCVQIKNFDGLNAELKISVTKFQKVESIIWN